MLANSVKVELEFDTVTPCSAFRAKAEAEKDTASFVSDDSKTTTSSAQTIEFGYLKSQYALPSLPSSHPPPSLTLEYRSSTFSDALLALVDAAKDLPPCGGSLPILEIDSDVRTQDEQQKKKISEDTSLAAQFCRLFALGDDSKEVFGELACLFLFPPPRRWGRVS